MPVAVMLALQRSPERLHDVRDLVALFDATFFASTRTLLLPHADAWKEGVRIEHANEPVYLPRSAACPVNRIVFAHGFFASALHEVAHWCIAGRKRRTLADYGYWYEPDDRDAVRQAEFERVEAKPQAIEMAFSRAARFPFRVSVDNLSGIAVDRDDFARKVQEQFEHYSRVGFPRRAQLFIEALEDFYGR